MNLRIATYNVNNLFQRANVLDLDGFSAKGRAILNDVSALSELLEKPSYAGATGAAIRALLTKYGFHKNKANGFFIINEIREKLFTVKKNPARIELKAAGRADWLGWVELTRDNVDRDATENTGRVIQAIKPDVLCVIEVESRPTLQRFNDMILKKFPPQFKCNLLVDGNDERGIDVALFSQHAIRSVRSHIDDSFTAANGQKFPIFSRDCPEYEVILPNGKTLWMLCNHFKSKGYGSPAQSNAKRKRQADKVREILLARFDLAKDLVVVAGDFNDVPGSAPLAGLLSTPNLFDVLDQFNGPRGTYESSKNQFDYLLVSKPLRNALTHVEIERRGIFDKNNPNAFAKTPTAQASDHCMVWAEFNL